MIYIKTSFLHLLAAGISINLQLKSVDTQPVPIPVAPVPTTITTPVAPVPVPVPSKAPAPIPLTAPVPVPVLKNCGLLGLSIFCPFTFCGIFGRLLGICKDYPISAPVLSPVQVPIPSPFLVAPIQAPIRFPVYAPVRSPVKVPVPVRTPFYPPVNAPVRTPARSPESPKVPISIPITRPNTPPMRPPPVPLRNRYDITLDFDESSVPTTDYNDFISAAKRWEEIIIGDLDDVPVSEIPTYVEPIAPGCSYPTGFIDDMYICVSYKQLSNGIIGQGTYTYVRSSNYLPVLGYIQIDPRSIDIAREYGYFNDAILHEIGHAIGLGTIANKCPTMNALSKASREYQRISQCTTSVPMEQSLDFPCAHFSEACLTTELMTPVLALRDSPISRISIGWLEDFGYDVNYTRADPFTSSQLGTIAGCNCNRQRQYQRTLWNNNNSTASAVAGHRYTTQQQQQQERSMRLSVDGYNTAVAYGMEYLQEKRMEHNKIMMEQSATSSSSTSTSSSSVRYVGDQFVWIYMLENDQIHSVLVQQP